MTDEGGWDPDQVPHHTDDDCPEWDPDYQLPAPATYITPNSVPAPAPDDDTEHTSWWPVDIAALFNGTRPVLAPTLFARTDGQPIIYPGKAHAFNGAPESGKSWAALVACVQAVNTGTDVLYLDFEDTAETVVTRLLALGADPQAVITHLTYISPAEALWWQHKITAGGLEFEELLDGRTYALAVLDGITEAMGIHGLDINSNNDVAAFYGMLPRKLQRNGTATVNIDHIPKNREGGTRGGIGGQHKLAGIDVSYLFEVQAPFGIGQHGTARISIEKDRPGQLRQHAEGTKHDKLGLFHLISDPDTHQLTAHLEPIQAPGHHVAGFEPTTLMERVSEFVAECNDNGTHPSQRTIEEGVKGKGEYVREAIARLVMHGHLQKGGHGRRVTDHTLITPYEAPEDAA